MCLFHCKFQRWKNIKSHFVPFSLQVSTSKKKLSLIFSLLHMRWFNVCGLCMIWFLLRLKISINRVTPVLCSIWRNFPAKRLRKNTGVPNTHAPTFKKNSTLQINSNRYCLISITTTNWYWWSHGFRLSHKAKCYHIFDKDFCNSRCGNKYSMFMRCIVCKVT